MSIVWAILGALSWGTADFFARLASDKIGSRSTVFFVQVFSLVMLVAILVVSGEPIPALTFRVLGPALLASVLNAVGMTAFYEALRRGPVSIVSPIASAFGGVTALIALALGEKASALQLLGMLAILIGIIGSTLGETSSDKGKGGIPLALLVIVFWGATFFLLTPAYRVLGRVLPVLILRIVTGAGHATYAVAARKKLEWKRAALPAVLGITLFDTTAFLLYGKAVQGGGTAVVVVIASLFSVVTVVLAALILKERLRARQWAAVALLFVGIGLCARA